MEYDNLIMTLSRVCFLYVADVLEGTSEIDWLKNPIGCYETGAPERENQLIVTNIFHVFFLLFLAHSLSLSPFRFYLFLLFYIINTKHRRETKPI